MTRKNQVFTKSLDSISLYPSRILIVQTIYSFDILEERKSLQEILHEYIEYHELKYPKDSLDNKFYHQLTHFIIDNKVRIDKKIILKLAHNWTIKRLPALVLSILRAGIGDIINGVLLKNLKTSILINDYLQITKSLNHFSELSFINSVLDAIAKDELLKSNVS